MIHSLIFNTHTIKLVGFHIGQNKKTSLSPGPSSLTLRILCSTFRSLLQLSGPLRPRVRHQRADLSQRLRGPLPGLQGPPVCLRPVSPQQPVRRQTLPEEPKVGPGGATSSRRNSVASVLFLAFPLLTPFGPSGSRVVVAGGAGSGAARVPNSGERLLLVFFLPRIIRDLARLFVSFCLLTARRRSERSFHRA